MSSKIKIYYNINLRGYNFKYLVKQKAQQLQNQID